MAAPMVKALPRGFAATVRKSLGPAWRVIALIWLVMVLRALTGQSFMTFMPLLYVQDGYSLVAAGSIFALFTVAGTISGIFLQLEGRWVYPGALLAGGFVLATLPLGVVMAQSLAPQGRSMVASLMMGFAFGLGGLAAPLIGRLADIYSIRTVLTGAALIPLVTVALIAFFPRVSTREPS